MKNDLTTTYIDPATDARWDNFVATHPFGWLTHSSLWQRVLERSFSHMKGYFPALVDAESGAIRAALPVYEVKSWLTGRRLVSIPWATLSDPLILFREEFVLLAKEAQELKERLQAGHLEIRSLYTTPIINDGTFADAPSFKHHYLNLEQDIEKIRKAFHRTCERQRSNRAQQRGLSLRMGSNLADLDILYGMHKKNRKKKCLPPQPYLFFKNLWQELYPFGNVSLLIAESDGEPVATLLLLKYKERMSAEVTQINEDFRSMSPNIFLLWEAIKQGAAEGYRVFDFGRTPPSNPTLSAFKSRWGAEVSDLCCFYYPEEKGKGLNDSYAKRYRMLQLVCRYTPEFVQPFIGRFCYRHTG